MKCLFRSHLQCVLIAIGLCALPLRQVPACIWDSETLAAELARLPEIADIMSGNFPRHSKAFYEWRVRTTTEKLKKAPHLVPLYDDLAVAQHKLGDHRAAIATMQAKEKRQPRLYETYSNLGTFYIYTGELNEALLWIDKALAINSNAHFGREKYQRWLVEWILNGKTGTAPNDATSKWGDYFGFARWSLEQSLRQETNKTFAASPNWMENRMKETKQGVLGMMRFADFDNPLLQ